MIKFPSLLVAVLFTLVSITSGNAQLVINELDSDTPGVDDKEFVEILSEQPFFSTDGFVLVFFNGSENGRDASYLALDLDGYQTDADGILVIGNRQVEPSPDFLLFDNTIQNGADAVAIYQADAEDFPFFTPATTDNLIDALVYDTNDADDLELLQLLGKTNQINEGENDKDLESIQRKSDGSYETKTPTPGALNDGSGIDFIIISLETEENQYEEGAEIQINFTASEAVPETVTFSINITNENFTNADFTGNLEITIPQGNTKGSTTIQTIDDTEDEGNESMIITFGTLPTTYKKINDRKQIRIIDNDFEVAEWGSPLSPTYDKVNSTAPDDYYARMEGKVKEELITAIGEVIADPDQVRAHSYDDMIQLLMEADQSPLNANNVWLLYTEQERSKDDFQYTNVQTGKWNREHIYPRSRGGFFSIDEDGIIDGIDEYWTSNIDSIRHGNSDAHALRPVDARENGRRSNKNYGEYTGPENTQGSWQGDVARAVFYMTMRYRGLQVVDSFPPAEPDGFIGKLSILLDWHRNDPPDDYEMNRNNSIYNWQKNRNPFIDHPELAEHIWGSKQIDPWMNPLSVEENTSKDLKIYPNPLKNELQINLNHSNATLEIFDVVGNLLISKRIENSSIIPLELSTGMYVVRVKVGDRVFKEKLIVR